MLQLNISSPFVGKRSLTWLWSSETAIELAALCCMCTNLPVNQIWWQMDRFALRSRRPV
jgi:hypothetical protein